VYETLPGWQTDTSGITSFDDLPAAAKDYIGRVEQLCGAPVSLISTGPDRAETIIRDDSPVSAWMK
jgi:adenylosuccinate synthase